MSNSLSKKQLHERIIGVVDKLRKQTVRTNVAGGEKCPIILSENDLCCCLFKELYDPKRYSIKTEVTVKRGRRNDLVILKHSESVYELSRNNNPKWDCESYLAIMELKVNFSSGPKSTKKYIKDDLDVLSNTKADTRDWSELYYMIMFDLKGTLEEKDLHKLKSSKKYAGICLIYADIKRNKRYQFPPE